MRTSWLAPATLLAACLSAPLLAQQAHAQQAYPTNASQPQTSSDSGTATDAAQGPAGTQAEGQGQMNGQAQMNQGGKWPYAHQPGTGESGPASSQASNIDSADSRSDIAPHLPSPDVGEDAGVRRYLAAAQQALQHHQSGEAQQALEMAETRMLDRSVPAARADMPSRNPRVEAVNQALQALGHKDWSGAQQAIETAMNTQGAGGMGTMQGGMGNMQPGMAQQGGYQGGMQPGSGMAAPQPGMGAPASPAPGNPQ